jgi:hypothetical protein
VGWQSPRHEPADLALEANISIKHLSHVEIRQGGRQPRDSHSSPPLGLRAARPQQRCWRPAVSQGNMASATCPRPEVADASAPSICCCGGTSRFRHVTDRQWNVLQGDRAATRLMTMLLGPSA